MYGGFISYAQSDLSYLKKAALNAGISQPVPSNYASLTVKRPVKMDSLSLTKFRHDYKVKMQAGTALVGGGLLVMVSHIMIVALVPHFDRNLVISLATIGIGSMTAGSVVLPLGASERHRYKKSLRIELAKRGF